MHLVKNTDICGRFRERTEARDTGMSKLLGADSLWRSRMRIYISV